MFQALGILPTLFVLAATLPELVGNSGLGSSFKREVTGNAKALRTRSSLLLDSLRGSSVNIGTIQRRLAWPLRQDDAHKLRRSSLLLRRAPAPPSPTAARRRP